MTATGWTLEYVDDLGMDRACELLEYYADYPLANVVLSLVHLKRGKNPVRRRMTESSAHGHMRDLSGMLGQSAERIPDHLRDMANWALAHSPKKKVLN